jgi:hypothetical protein
MDSHPSPLQLLSATDLQRLAHWPTLEHLSIFPLVAPAKLPKAGAFAPPLRKEGWGNSNGGGDRVLFWGGRKCWSVPIF